MQMVKKIEHSVILTLLVSDKIECKSKTVTLYTVEIYNARKLYNVKGVN